MKFLENYALAAGQKIGKMRIYEKFIPLPTQNYIVIHPQSKNSKSYDYFQDIINLLAPILDKQNIKIVQIGHSSDRKLAGVIDYANGISINQSAYVIKNSILVLGVDSWSLHAASASNKFIVGISCNNFTHNIQPYFGDKDKQIYFEPDRTKFPRPCFSYDENPKSVNTIKVEDIAAAVLKLLNLPFDYPYKTLYTGISYSVRQVELIPDQCVNLSSFGTDTAIMRMDIKHDENFLNQQLNISNVAIVTSQKIDINLLNHYRAKIKEFVYILDENHDPKYAESVQRLGIKLHLHTYLPDEKLNDIKLDYLDIGIIIKRKEITKNEIEELKNKDINKLYYRTNRLFLSQSKVYTSVSNYLAGLVAPSFNFNLEKVSDNLFFWRDIDFYSILEKTDSELTF